MATKKKGEIRLTSTIDMGEFEVKRLSGTTKKRGYLTIFTDELPLLGMKGVSTTGLKEVKITKGKLAGRTIYSAIDDTAATGRHFKFLYLQKAATKTERAKYDTVQIYFPSWLSTRQAMGWIEKIPKKPAFVVTDLKTRIRPLRSKGGATA
jgi:hypothetical protein